MTLESDTKNRITDSALSKIHPPSTSLKTLQIATFGEEPENVLIGVRNFPIHKLSLICLEEHVSDAQEFSSGLKSVLRIPVEILAVGKPVLETVLEAFAKILAKERGKYQDYVVNVAGGEKLLGCAALSAAFINGLKAIGVEGKNPVMLPIIKLSYSELISDAKKNILRAIYTAGGVVDSLQHLSEISNYGKPLLSYHIHGADDAKGLEDLGLVSVKKSKRGRTIIQLSVLGKMLLLGTESQSIVPLDKKSLR